jgi:hypothetical protein
MFKDLLRDMAQSQTPDVPVEIIPDTHRWNVIDSLTGHENIGIELGVAAGSFSARMVQSGKFHQFFGVDVYGDTHDITEYKKALRTVGLRSNYHLLRMTFDDALDVFPDNFFDFIYVDGYAHTGEEGGRTLIDWYAKLKPGGVMAGDDYDAQRWPLVVWAVHHLVAQLGLSQKVTDQVQDAAYNKFRSWFFTKPVDVAAVSLTASPELVNLGDMEKAAKAEERKKRQAARKAQR